ncbi:hypothetical protein CHS0354_029830 [Potamilus streckersoni]|uniref:CREB-regulated transcription coactivator 1 n=1 Tax=Potamilus streckersoni TaxID=2493646 RepID=A0AAE0VEA6_9BIVA|nr:hypothetical protein CHS0354_029830 [Potamilus streckersoni]
MANPRKFSEKIALHTQKQAEETAAFEAILRDVSAATRAKQSQHLHIQQNIMGQYRGGGSLPNVNQIATAASSGIDLQMALQLESMSRGNVQVRTDRMHPRDRGRQQIGPLRRAFPIEKTRADCSPYGSTYLSPPPDTSWRRTNSDSALHTSTMGPGPGEPMQSPTTPPQHRRLQEVVGENDMMKQYSWDPKKMTASRPRSCEMPNMNHISQSGSGGDPGCPPQMHIPISNNTGGSLPDLTILQFPSPLTTPIDMEDQNNYTTKGSQAGLSPTSAHHMNHMNMVQSQHASGGPQSPVQRRRPNNSGPSPLVLSGSPNQTMRMPCSPPVSHIDPSRLSMDPSIRQQYMLYLRQQQQRHRTPGVVPPHPTGSMGGGSSSPSDHNNHIHQHQHHQHQQPQSSQQPTSPLHNGRTVPQVCVTSPCDQNGSESSMSQYRNNISDTGCQSPTSPLSQPSYSPSQSPGLPSSTWNNSVFELESYQLQQQQQTNALQHQFEQFSMLQDNQVSSGDSGSFSNSIYTNSNSSLNYSQANMHGMAGNQEFHQQQHQQQFYSHSLDYNSSQSQHIMNMVQQSSQQQQQQPPLTPNSKIPDIVFTGADDHLKQDFAKELGNAMSGMSDSFDSELFGSVSDEVLKVGLDPLDLDGLQMLTDPTMVTDPDTENSFRLDHRLDHL